MLLRAASFILALLVPFGETSHRWQDNNQAVLDRHYQHNLTEWDLDRLPSPNGTDHLVFETVHSLLQHWPNTRMRNGHNIVPGVIPKGTLLYRGWHAKIIPPGPEWVSTDPEHSYLFCQNKFGVFQQGCWHLTLTTTRPLKIVYFDGSSAAKMPDGTLDTQDLVAWGKFGTGHQNEESQRIEDLCKWGRSFDVDAFVRMEMDFEVMICDFTAGLGVVSFVNLLGRGAVPPITPAFVNFEVLEAGSWHNRFPGETRVQLDLTRLISLYDAQLVPSLVPIRAGQERWNHRVRNISNEDIPTVKSRLEAALVRSESLSSGIDWKTLIQVIIDRFAGRLELTRHLLNSSALHSDPNQILDLANKTQTQLRIMLTPYILLSAAPTDPLNKMDMNWTKPIYKLCATAHTYFMGSQLDPMTDSEKLLLRAVRGTNQEICRVVARMWAAGVYAGIDSSLNTKEFPDIAEVTNVQNAWTEDLNRLMGWLDWNVWVKCNPVCGPKEMCYLPTWPVNFPRTRYGPGRKPRSPSSLHPEAGQPPTDYRARAIEDDKIIMPESDEWMRPQPKCIRRLAPHEY